MVKNNMKKYAVLFSLLLAAALFLSAFTAPVSAKDAEGPGKEEPDTKLKLYQEAEESEESISGTGVHKDPTVFEKNFCLTPAQKEIAIGRCEEGAAILNDGMSDLEKYYMLALWENYQVRYDSAFWPAGYDFDYYSHQWDAFGVLEEHLAVCAGIAVTYANLCHAAGLPCKFVRCDPSYLDHTINHIPDINGNPYYIDVTENSFFMSKDSNWSFEPIDLAFSKIPDEDRPSDGSFEYYEKSDYSDETQRLPANIKDFYEGKIGEGAFEAKPFATWYKEYALHKNKAKKFVKAYKEKGSGNGTCHASYTNFGKYPAQPYASRTGDVTDIWFLNDFYLEPQDIESKIRDSEFDEQLLIISGVEENYDFDSDEPDEFMEALENAIRSNIAVKYFPSLEGDEIVAKSTELNQGTQYEVTYTGYNSKTHEAILTITAVDGGGYFGESEFRVKVNSALVEKTPIRNKNLTYDGTAQQLLDPENPGKAINGRMQYAIGTQKAPTGEFSYDIPTATNAGTYYIWYKAKGDEFHHDSEPQRIKQPAVINPEYAWINVQDVTNKVGETIKLKPVLEPGLEATFAFECYDEDIATVSKDGTVKGVAAGVTTVSIHAILKDSSSNYELSDNDITVTVLPEDSTKADKAKLTFDPSGGTWEEGGTDIKVIEAGQGTEFRIIDAPKRDGYTFEYWEGSKYQPGQKYTVNGDHTFTAKWSKSDSADPNNSGKGTGKGTKTGDSFALLPWLLLMLASGGTIAVLVLRRRHS